MIYPIPQVPLAPLSSIHLGGNAQWYLECNSRADIIAGLAWGQERNLPVHILGGGSNSLFSDAGFPGLVLRICTKGITWSTGGLVSCEAGENWDDFVASSLTHHLRGLESLSGIPGLVGATPIQNVGAYGQDVSQSIVRVVALDRKTLTETIFSNIDCEFTYRQSRFKVRERGRYVILAVQFKLDASGSIEISYPELEDLTKKHPDWGHNLSRCDRLFIIRESVLQIRRRKGMVIDPSDPNSNSLGSFFTNPIVSKTMKDKILQVAKDKGLAASVPVYPSGVDSWKLSAAWLIEQSGTSRGERHGGAGVSSKHALAIINADHATTEEVLALAEKIEARVYNTFGLDLDLEPELIG
ncbi:MAG: UDP-N-acetylmuramate dehydrogenase [Proteobacteria bacterium]|nr:UDP-N-acetylmuramate dehydrogenase [Pseudomonadota bacterium]